MCEGKFLKTVVGQYLLSIYSMPVTVPGVIPSLFYLLLSLNSLPNSVVTFKMNFEGKTYLSGAGRKYQH